MDRQRGKLEQVRRCGFDQVPEPRRLALGLRELAQAKRPDLARGAEALSHPEARVRLAALELAAVEPRPEWLPRRARAARLARTLIEASAAAGVVAKVKDPTASLPAVRALAARVPREPQDVAEPVGTALVAFMAGAAEPELRQWLESPGGERAPRGRAAAHAS